MDYLVLVTDPKTGEEDTFAFSASSDKSPRQEAQEYVDQDYPGCNWVFVDDDLNPIT